MPSIKPRLKVYSAGAVSPPPRDAIVLFEKQFDVSFDLNVGAPSARGVSPKRLADTLKQLQHEGLLVRKSFGDPASC